MWVNTSELITITMHESYKRDDITCQNTFGVKMVQTSKVKSYLEVNAKTDWWQQDLISEYRQGFAYWTHEYYTRHIIAIATVLKV